MTTVGRSTWPRRCRAPLVELLLTRGDPPLSWISLPCTQQGPHHRTVDGIAARQLVLSKGLWVWHSAVHPEEGAS
jgi:hypothetical protein